MFERFRDYSGVVQALAVITLLDAQARYKLTPAQVRLIEALLAGKERKLASGSGLNGYFIRDIEDAIRDVE